MKALQILFLFCTAVLYGQYAGWSSFYSFDQITAVHYGDNGQIYGVAQNSLFSYDPTANEMVPITTVNGLLGDEIDAPSENLKEVEVYPNPIRPNYTGLLTVRGLQSDCVVKITDIVGNVVFETTTTGGSIQWDLRSFSGERVLSGVYLIFVTTNDGLESAVEKVMIIN